MTRYIVFRLLGMVTVLVVLSFACYGLMGLMPGDPVDILITSDPSMTPELAQMIREKYHLDKPIVERYVNWATDALQGNLGISRIEAKPVLEVLWPRVGKTLILLGWVLIFSILIAIPLGVWAGTHPRSKLDYTINMFCFAGISMPSFWLCIQLIFLFAVVWHILPPGGEYDFRKPPTLMNYARYLVLPVMALTILSLTTYTRHMRSSMLETFRQDYVRTAFAKGANWQRVVWKHAFQNAMLPVATLIGLELGLLFSGALIVEQVFSRPGMGKLIYESIMGNDYNVAMVSLLFATFMILVGNFVTDFLYAWLDPRISIHKRS